MVTDLTAFGDADGFNPPKGITAVLSNGMFVIDPATKSFNPPKGITAVLSPFEELLHLKPQ